MITGALTASAEMPLSEALNTQRLTDTVWNKLGALSSFKLQQHQQTSQGATGCGKNPRKPQNPAEKLT